ncbi:MAG: VOC family protein [SAR202 cluster bacterium]|nr:VOC family protein [SAR202 cluster bacterium]|tara:strand:+ start:85 stop:480 length:396 start_codon:yes stop_codon:yes gene_type:complete
MKIKLISIPVFDQEKALEFYTEKLGFIKKQDVPLGDSNRWLTLVSPEWQDGPELLLEPAPKTFEPSKIYQDALMEAGIPYTQFEVISVDAEYERLANLGVDFTVKPTEIGVVKIAVFNDTCGNFIQIIESV